MRGHLFAVERLRLLLRIFLYLLVIYRHAAFCIASSRGRLMRDIGTAVIVDVCGTKDPAPTAPRVILGPSRRLRRITSA